MFSANLHKDRKKMSLALNSTEIAWTYFTAVDSLPDLELTSLHLELQGEADWPATASHSSVATSAHAPSQPAAPSTCCCHQE